MINKQGDFPTIPFIGVYTKDLLVIDEAMPHSNTDGTVNMDRVVGYGKQLKSLLDFQSRIVDPTLLLHTKVYIMLIDTIRTQGSTTPDALFATSKMLYPN
jgi:hypothetical protein